MESKRKEEDQTGLAIAREHLKRAWGKMSSALLKKRAQHPQHTEERFPDAAMPEQGVRSDVSQGQRTTTTEGDYIEHVEGNVYSGEVHIHPPETPLAEDPTPMRETYLRRLLETCRQVFLSGIDRIAARQDVEPCLNLEAIYIALLTLGAEHEKWEKEHRVTDVLQRRRERRLSALDQLNRHDRLVLLGGPGSGKSTFVNFVTLCLAGDLLENQQINLDLLTRPLPPEKASKDQQEKENTPERQEWRHGSLLPVRVILRDFAAEGLPAVGEQATANHLWEFIVNDLKETPFGDYTPYLRQHLLESGGLVLLDGLDEVPEAHTRRKQLRDTVEDFARVFPHCRLLVTSRTYAYQRQEWRLTGFVEAVLAPFTTGQIRCFVDCWYEHSASLLGMRPGDVGKRAELLKRAIFGSQRLYRFAERPLLLTLMASLHAWRGGSLPEKRQELYDNAVDLLLDWWESRKVKDTDGEWVSLTERLNLGREGLEDLRRLISKLAYEAHATQPDLEGTANIEEDTLAGGLMRLIRDSETNRNTDLNPLWVAEYLRDRAGLLVSHGVGLYTFPHRTFQEYLAACYLTDQDDYPENVAELARSDPNRWREVVLLAGAKAARGAASTIWALADALCYRDVEDRETSDKDAWGALLAGQALAETANLEQISPRNRPKAKRVRKWLVEILTARQPSDSPLPPVERVKAGNIVVQLEDPRPGIGLRKDDLPDIEWCEVLSGTFLMGSDPKKDKEVFDREQPQHEVRLSAYCISRYPVTNAQYRAFVEDGGYMEKWRQCWTKEGWKWKEEKKITTPATYGGTFDLPNHPVVGVSWYETSAFCHWLTLRLQRQGELSEEHVVRLPTDAEWEKAARGDDGRIYPWGDEQITPEHANYYDTGLGVTSTVGCFPRGKSPYGCEEMAGNVYEWCLDWFDENYYSESPKENPQGPETGSFRVIRGGFWGVVARYCRSAYRSYGLPDLRDYGFGFRLLRTP